MKRIGIGWSFKISRLARVLGELFVRPGFGDDMEAACRIF